MSWICQAFDMTCIFPSSTQLYEERLLSDFKDEEIDVMRFNNFEKIQSGINNHDNNNT